MAETNRVLVHLLALPDFSAQELADRSGVNIHTVRTVLRRLPANYVESVGDGTRKRKRGGQAQRRRLSEVGREEIAARLRGERADTTLQVIDVDLDALVENVDTTLAVAEEAVTRQRAGTIRSSESPASLARLVHESIDAAEFELATPELARVYLPGALKLRAEELRRRVDRLRTALASVERGSDEDAAAIVSTPVHVALEPELPATSEYAALGVEDLTARDLVELPGGPDELVSVAPQDTVSHALGLMSKYDLEKLPVIRKGRQCGEVHFDDLLRALAANNQVRAARLEGFVKALIWPEVRIDEPVASVGRKLEESNASHALVRREHEFWGVVSRDDVYRAAYRELSS